ASSLLAPHCDGSNRAARVPTKRLATLSRLALPPAAAPFRCHHHLDDDLSFDLKDHGIGGRNGYGDRRVPPLLLRRETRQCWPMQKIAARKITSATRSIFAHACRAVAFGVGGPIFALAQIAHAQPPPDDTARFLAGMPLSKNSTLASLTSDPTWQENSGNFEQALSKPHTTQFVKWHGW